MYIIVAFWLFVAKQPKKVFNTYKQAVLQLPMFWGNHYGPFSREESLS